MGVPAAKSNEHNASNYLRKRVDARMEQIRQTLGVPQPPKRVQEPAHDLPSRKQKAA